MKVGCKMKNKKVLIIIGIIITLLLTIVINKSPKLIMKVVNPTNKTFAWKDSLYLNTSTFDLYQKNEKWNSIGNLIGTDVQINIYVDEEGYVVLNGEHTKINLKGLKGEQGNEGTQGKDGEDGKKDHKGCYHEVTRFILLHLFPCPCCLRHIFTGNRALCFAFFGHVHFLLLLIM